jgi:signal peptidase I
MDQYKPYTPPITSDTLLNPKQAPPPPEKKDSFFGEIIKFTLIALLIVLPIRLFIAQPFIVQGASMDPTFASNEYLIVDQLSYRVGEPHRGEVVIFKYPKDQTKFFIKRVIGLPGETVVLDGTSVTVKNTAHPDGFVLDEPYISDRNEKEESLTMTLKENQYFVLGDNRRQSFDSRSWGILPRDLIIGKPFVRLYPFDKLGVFPGNFNESN